MLELGPRCTSIPSTELNKLIHSTTHKHTSQTLFPLFCDDYPETIAENKSTCIVPPCYCVFRFGSTRGFLLQSCSGLTSV